LITFSLSKRINDHEVLGFLELNSRVPLLIGWHLLGSLLVKPSIEPKVQGKLI